MGGVAQGAMAGSVPKSWLERGLAAEEDLAPRPPGAYMLAAHDTVTIKSRQLHQKLGKLVNRGWHAVHTTSLEQLPEDGTPLPGQSTGCGGTRPRPSPRLAI